MTPLADQRIDVLLHSGPHGGLMARDGSPVNWA